MVSLLCARWLPRLRFPQSNEFSLQWRWPVPVSIGSAAFGACVVIERPDHMSAFEYVVVCSMRAEQLIKGSTPRVTRAHRHTTTAREEVALGLVVREPAPPTDKPLP
jgi:DNA-directed RNA polymerase subunit K/omega